MPDSFWLRFSPRLKYLCCIYQIMSAPLLDSDDKLVKSGCKIGTAFELDCSGEVCSITLQNLHSGAQVCRLPCNHVFDKSSIVFWLLNKKPQCPLCKKKVYLQLESLSPTEEEIALGILSITFMQEVIDSLLQDQNDNNNFYNLFTTFNNSIDSDHSSSE